MYTPRPRRKTSPDVRTQLAKLLEENLQLKRELCELRSEVAALKRELEGAKPYAPIPPFPWPDPNPSFNRCAACGLELSGALGYVCTRIDCPTGLGPVLCKAVG